MNLQTQPMMEDFLTTFCRRFNCPVESFERKVFWRCLYPQAFPVAWLILLLRSEYFANDLQTIRQLGIVRTREEMHAELDALAYLNRQQGGTLRNSCKVRVSGRRLLRLYDEVFADGQK